MDKTYVNIFNGVLDKDTSKKMSVIDVLWKISEGHWKSKINAYRFETDKARRESLKKRLPAVTFAGCITGNSRLDDNLKNYTGILVCDIDKITPGKLNSYKESLSNDNYVLGFFESPSKGLKVLVKVDSELKHHNQHAFLQVEEYMKEHYDIVIDPSGKNPSRLCFISHDPDMFYNESYDVFPVDTSIDYEALEASKNMQSVKYIRDNFEASSDSRYVFNTACDWISKSKTGHFRKGNRNNFIFVLSCRLSEAGLHADTAINMIVNRYPSLGFKETKITVYSAYKRTASSFGTKPINQRKTNQGNIF